MVAIFNNEEKGWSLGLLYEDACAMEYLHTRLNMGNTMNVKQLANWLSSHNIKAVAYCVGTLRERIRSYYWCRQFNQQMKRNDMCAELKDIWDGVQEFVKSEEEGCDKN